jgi:hypothetical protein
MMKNLLTWGFVAAAVAAVAAQPRAGTPKDVTVLGFKLH